MDSVIQFEGTIYENGYGLLAQKVMRDRSLKGPSKLIYAYMCSFASIGKNGDRLAFPSVSLQCAELNMSEDTYYKWRKPLVDKGYINITRQRQEGAKFDNNVYSIVAVPVENKKVVDLEEKRPYPKKSGMENKPYPKFPSTENPSTENSGTNSNSFNSNIFNNKKDEEEEDQQAELIALFSDCISPANRIVEKKIIEWLGKLPFEVIKAEIENAALNGGRSWNYVQTLLEQDEKNNFRSVDDVNKKVTEYNSRKKKRGSTTKKPVRTEILPEWFEENNKENKVENANNEDMEAKKRAIAEKLKAFNSK